jgi:hypothetical protein
MEYSCIFIIMFQTYSFCNVYRVSESVIVISKLNDVKRGLRKIDGGGRSATGILHFLNQTPIDWFSKRQNTVETATFGSEFVAARQCTEQVYDLRYTLRMMGSAGRNGLLVHVW